MAIYVMYALTLEYFKPKVTIQGAERQSNGPSTARPWAKDTFQSHLVAPIIVTFHFKKSAYWTVILQFSLLILLAGERRDSLNYN